METNEVLSLAFDVGMSFGHSWCPPHFLLFGISYRFQSLQKFAWLDHLKRLLMFGLAEYLYLSDNKGSLFVVNHYRDLGAPDIYPFVQYVKFARD